MRLAETSIETKPGQWATAGPGGRPTHDLRGLPVRYRLAGDDSEPSVYGTLTLWLRVVKSLGYTWRVRIYVSADGVEHDVTPEGLDRVSGWQRGRRLAQDLIFRAVETYLIETGVVSRNS